MPKQLTRSITTTPLLDAMYDAGIDFKTGEAFSAAFEQPAETGLLVRQGLLAFDRDDFGDDVAMVEKYRAIQQDAENARELQILIQQLDFTYKPEEKEALRAKITDLRNRGTNLEEWRMKNYFAGNLVGVDEINEKYAAIGIKTDRPMSEVELERLVEYKEEEQVRNVIMESGPEGALSTLQVMSGALIKAAIDPLGIASAFIPVVGEAKAALLVQRFGRIKGRAIQGAQEGLAGATLLEPLMYGLSESQQMDYTYVDSLLNVGAGALIGSGLGTVAGALSRQTAGQSDLEIEVKRDERPQFNVPAGSNQQTITIDPNTKANPEDDSLDKVTVTIDTTLGPSETFDKTRQEVAKRADLALRMAGVGVNVNVEFVGPIMPTRVEAVEYKGKFYESTKSRNDHILNEWYAGNYIDTMLGDSHHPKGSKAYFARVNIDDFLRATTINQKHLDEIVEEAGDFDPDRFPITSAIQLKVIFDESGNGKVFSHEGRHRLAALKKAGYREIPMAIIRVESSKPREVVNEAPKEFRLKGEENDDISIVIKNPVLANYNDIEAIEALSPFKVENETFKPSDDPIQGVIDQINTLVKDDSDMLGFDLTDQQISQINAEIRNGVSLDRAYKKIGFDSEARRAKMIAEYANDPKNQAGSITDKEAPDYNIKEEEEIIAQESIAEDQSYIDELERQGQLTDEEISAKQAMEDDTRLAEQKKSDIEKLHTCVMKEEY